MEYLRRLVSHTAWANRLWLDFTYGAAREESYLTRLTSHIYLAEQVWFQRIRGAAEDKEVFKTRTRDELLRLAEGHGPQYAELLAGDLTRIVVYRRFNGDEYASPLSDILLHLVIHGAHHRGQLAAYAAQRKLGPPSTDFITFSRGRGKP